MPKTLYQRPAPSPEDEHIAGEWIALEMLLHQQREPGHALAHIRVARGDPNPNSARDRDHRSARNAASTKAGVASAVIFTVLPGPSSTRIAVSTGKRGSDTGPSS